MIKTYFNWSSGKDAALAYYYLSQSGEFDIDCFLTSVNNAYDRVSMHGLRRELLEAQVKAIGVKSKTIELPAEPSMEEYGQIMRRAVEELVSDGYKDCAFGDIFLEDLREYREGQLLPLGVKCHFPLWKRDTSELIRTFIELGFKSKVICFKSNLLDESFVGRDIDEDFLNDLPSNVDPCGENGEFHTFCYDGPIFQQPLAIEIGEKVYKEYTAPKGEESNSMGFWFCDLTLKK